MMVSPPHPEIRMDDAPPTRALVLDSGLTLKALASLSSASSSVCFAMGLSNL